MLINTMLINTFFCCRNLMGNPLVCDCHMSWLLQLPTTITIQEAYCMEPETLQGQNLIDIAASSLNQTCPGNS